MDTCLRRYLRLRGGQSETTLHPRLRGDERKKLHQRISEAAPIRVSLFNQPDLPGAFPFLDAALSLKSRLARLVNFNPYKHFAIILCREAAHHVLAMLPCAPVYVVRHAGIEHAVRLVRHDVDVEGHDVWLGPLLAIRHRFHIRSSPTQYAPYKRTIMVNFPAETILPSACLAGTAILNTCCPNRPSLTGPCSASGNI